MRARRTIMLAAAAALGLAGVTTAGVVVYKMIGGAGDNQQDLLAGLVSRTLSTPATQVHIGAVDGALSSDATIRDVTITDKEGTWLKLDRARLVWRRTALVLGRLEIDRLEIGTLEIRRKPLAADQPVTESEQPPAATGRSDTEPGAPAAQPGPSAARSSQPILPDLPVKVQVKVFDLHALVLGEPVLGEPASIAATGNAELGSPSEGLIFNLDATRKDFPGRFKMALAFVPKGNALTLDVTLDEPSHGLLSKLGRFPGEPPITFALRGNGTLDSFRGALKFQAGPTIDATGAIMLDRDGTGRVLATRINGHLGPWLPPLAASVFAGETRLDSATRIGDDGSVVMDGLTLTSRLARLEARGALGADKMMDFSATVRSLPSNGDVTETGQGSIRSLTFDGRVNGSAKAPHVSARLAVSDARLPDGNLDALEASINVVPDAELSDLAATIAIDASLRASGIALRDPALAAAIGDRASLVLKGTTDLGGVAKIERLEVGTSTVQATYTGEASQDRLRGHATGTVPDLSRFEGLAGLQLAGTVKLGLDLDGDLRRGRIDAKLSGTGDRFATGLPALDGLAGPRVTLAADFSSGGNDTYTVRAASLDAAHVTVRAKGGLTRDASDLAARIELPNLTAADARLAGAASLDARLTGGLAHPGLSLTAALDRVTAMQRPIPHLGLNVTVADINGPCAIDVKLDGAIDGKPARGIVQASRRPMERNSNTEADQDTRDKPAPVFAGWDARTIDITIGSVSLKGAGTIDAQNLARGQLRFAAGSLADIAPLALIDLAGAASLDLALSDDSGRQSVRLVSKGTGLRADATAIRNFDLRAEGSDLYSHPVLNADARINGAEIGGQTIANATLSAKGNAESSTISLSAKAAGFNLDAAGVLTPKENIRFDLNRFTAKRGARTIALQRPASFTLNNDTVRIQHLAIGIGGGRFTLDGTAGKVLDLKAVASAVPLADADVAVPGLGLGGTLDAAAEIGGSASAPTGQYKIAVKRLTAPPARNAAVPPIDITLDGRLDKTRTKLNATASAGKAGTFTAAGTVPFDASGTIALTAKGRLDAAVANAMLSASGRTVSGIVQLDARVGGTRARPQVGGFAAMSGGSFRDSQVGTRLDAIEAKVTAEGERISIERLSATTPNGGALSGSGQVRIAPDAGFPGTVSIRGQQATLAASALATARANLDVNVTGALARDPKISGRVDLTHVSVDIPERLPSTLKPIDGIDHVNATGQAATRLAAARKAEAAEKSNGKGRQALFNAALDVTVSAPNHVFVHGRGVNAELGGSLHVGGTTNKPVTKGAFSLYRGKMTALGKTLNFTKGNLSFNGDLAPELDFAAEIEASDITAQIGISGPAAAPAFAFTSRPELPQDEILSRILFQKASGNLTTAQALQLAQVAAQFAGGGDGVLDRMRRSLGVDSLDVGVGSGGGPMVGASRAIGDRLSVGVRTGASASQSGLSANVDVTRHIRVESDVDARGATSMGVGMKFEW
ncbi:MAG TPA: translocation/assembly module TamB domain-containing protein [Nitrobacter sp.]|nr:translocation/assembly module TamB domain-containing protein [Nitrobacter sp.]